MEPEGSLPCLQESTTASYSEPDASYIAKAPFDITFPYMPRSSE